LLLGKVTKIVATRCQILKLKCTKFDLRGAYSAPPDPLAGLRGTNSKGGKGRGREGKGRRGKGEGGESLPPL